MSCSKPHHAMVMVMVMVMARRRRTPPLRRLLELQAARVARPSTPARRGLASINTHTTGLGLGLGLGLDLGLGLGLGLDHDPRVQLATIT